MSETTTSLKEKNRLPLSAVVAANLVAVYGTIQFPAILHGQWVELWSGIEKAIPAAGGLAAMVVLNGLISPLAKARLIFWRWQNPLPGSLAFTKYGPADPRVEMDHLELAYGPLPTEPPLQNKLWYSLYKRVQTEPSVAKAHQDFLFTRDFAALAFFMLLILGPLTVWQLTFDKRAFYYVAVLIVQLALAIRSARVYGISFVTNVLAVSTRIPMRN